MRSNRQSSEKESMINENKIRETCASNRGRGFKAQVSLIPFVLPFNEITVTLRPV